MQMQRIAALLLLIAVAPLQAGVIGKVVNYTAGDTVMQGYLAWDDTIDGKRPGILVVHEWWGQNDYARKRAEMLAKLGYAALAVDMYGDGKMAEHPEDAGKFAGSVRKDLPLMQARFNAARDFLDSQPFVNPQENAAIGYCFGGSVVLSMARAGADLAGVVSFHGSLGGLPPVSDKVTAKVLVANGAEDTFVSAESIAVFKDDMDAAGADYTFINYPGAKHSFTNPGADVLGKQFTLPLEYNAAADAASWQAMQDFFKTIFK
jgi:dienelactone hydrolase